ncbi:MAG TPA: carboxylesterase family protein [Candidatus Micrarchaeaceae archaeon]|nr:carboxylesterase family protein [Candidatus Micrarchaeaceae archaeon]
MKDRLVAKTTSGRVEGMDDRGTIAFKGIPFAAPPVGPLRFRPPQPPPSWDGVRRCHEPGPACPQDSGLASLRYRASEPKSEDCLYLNLWTPALDDARRPVLVFLHGGGYQSGSGAVAVYNGAQFARHGAVLITCNYRLALFGFLYLDELFKGFEGTGNLAILDHIRVLEWIRENIAAFGGDPENVTVFGSSAGGISVGALMASHRAKGLFRRAAPMSSGPGPARLPELATRVAQRFLDIVDVRPGDTEALLALPTARLVLIPESSSIPDRVQSEPRDSSLMRALREVAGGHPTQSVVDGIVLTKTPLEAVAGGSAAGVDLLAGCTTEELRGSFWKLTAPAPDPDLSAGAHAIPDEEKYDLAKLFDHNGHPLQEVRRVYSESLLAAGRPVTDRDIYAAASSDGMIMRTIKFSEAQSLHHVGTYMYQFAWPSPAAGGLLGAFHGMATPFIFDNLHEDPSWEAVLGAAPPERIAAQFHGALVKFAATGKPGHELLPEWPAYEVGRRATMRFDVESRLVHDPERPRRLLHSSG